MDDSQGRLLNVSLLAGSGAALCVGAIVLAMANKFAVAMVVLAPMRRTPRLSPRNSRSSRSATRSTPNSSRARA